MKGDEKVTIYLNTINPLENYRELLNEEYFVDKSSIIEILNKRLFTKSKYICLTRPRRFGKSSVAHMLGAYYSKAVDSKNIFDNLNIISSGDIVLVSSNTTLTQLKLLINEITRLDLKIDYLSNLISEKS